MYATKIAALLAFCATGAFAADVYADFLDDNGNSITSTHFDVANTGCFSVGPAYQVRFSQSSPLPGQVANGPYCLFAWAEGGCSGDFRATEQFQGITIGDSYVLNDGISASGSYRFQATACQ